MILDVVLKRGSGGPSAPESERKMVEQFQTSINKVGAMLKPDGDFGIATERAVQFVQKTKGEEVNGKVNKAFIEWSESLENPYPELNVNGIAYIAKAETGGLSYYDNNAQFPHYPGGKSGITIGVGFDLGQNSTQEFTRVWSSYLSSTEIAELSKDSKLKNRPKRGSKKRARELKKMGIQISFDIAWQVFTKDTLPDYYDKTQSIYPSLPNLPDLCRSALVSLIYNRGSSLSKSDRRKEMRNIQELLRLANLEGFASQSGKNALRLIEDEFVKMKRHWPSQSGLIRRRQDEANLWRNGLAYLV